VWHRLFRRAIAVVQVSGCAIVLTTLSGVTSLADPGPADLALSPSQGSPGTWFKATATGFDGCLDSATSPREQAAATGSPTIYFQWDGGAPKVTTVDAGSASIVLTVPEDAELGAHTVTASCAGGPEATAEFTVRPAEEPALTLAPDQGGPGTSFTATATGFAPCLEGWYGGGPHTMSFYWDDRDLAPSQTGIGTGDNDRVQVDFTVPDDANTGAHKVAVWCSDHQASATFTVSPPEKPALTLAPPQGNPGTSFTATATGFGTCRAMSFQWGDKPLEASTTGVDSQAFTLVVPDDAQPGAQTVTASCAGGPEATATFTVVVAAKPTLTLGTGKGTPGSQFTASGTGFTCEADRVQLVWDGDIPLEEAPAPTFTVQLTVPSGALIGDHSVVASCRDHPGITDSQPFTVTGGTTSANGPAVLTLRPTSGRPGDEVRVAGDRFSCTRSRIVALSWDDGTQLPNASLDPSDHFDTSISVPAATDAGRHTLRASCSDGSVVMAADFTVLAGPTTTSVDPPPPISGWLIALIIGVVALLVLAYVRWRARRPRPPNPPARFQAVPRPGGPPLVTVHETPVNGEATHAIRLETHSDPGIQIIREGEDDRARP
jgi:hypothetical protein